MSRQSPGTRAPARRGDEEELFRRHNHPLVALVQRRLGVSREVAEDACALAWLQLLRRQPGRERIVGWLYTVAKHEAFALLRRTRRESPDDEVAARPDGLDLDDAIEARRALRLLDWLKPQQRLVLRLRMEGHSYASIQACTGQSYTWVNRHVTEGRRALRERLDRGDA